HEGRPSPASARGSFRGAAPRNEPVDQAELWAKTTLFAQSSAGPGRSPDPALCDPAKNRVESALFLGWLRPTADCPATIESETKHGDHSPDEARGEKSALLSRRRDRQPQAPGRTQPRARRVLQSHRASRRDEPEARPAAHRLLGRQGRAALGAGALPRCVVPEAGDRLSRPPDWPRRSGW